MHDGGGMTAAVDQGDGVQLVGDDGGGGVPGGLDGCRRRCREAAVQFKS